MRSILLHDPILRVIDANLNRCREGVRVVEEFFRFSQKQKEPALFCKKFRHNITRWLLKQNQISLEHLCQSRCVRDDFFKDEMCDSEKQRTDVVIVMQASVQRVKESLRVVEEYSKIFSSDWAFFFQMIRFEWYDFEKKFCGKEELLNQ